MDNQLESKSNFKPYVAASKAPAELTVTAVVVGVILAILFGAANAYLGLRVGLTVSASIPAAVIAMAVIRLIMRRNSILESNMVQTIGSAGESLAAGAIFTLPALFLWAEEGLRDVPSLLQITLIALCGGLLGVFFMIPLRNALIVREHATLLYPEGTACAKILLAGDKIGEKGKSNASLVFLGIAFGAVLKFLVDALKLIPSAINLVFKSYRGEISAEVYPSLTAIGYIVGPRISSFMFAGSVVGWMVIIPLMVMFGAEASIYPADAGVTVQDIYNADGAGGIWSNYLRYIGVGAIVVGGIISLIETLPVICHTFVQSVKGFSTKQAGTDRTSRDLSFKVVLPVILLLIIAIWLIPSISVNLLGAVIIVIFGFIFATVSSRMVGLIGSSNNPVSGMTIATLLIATILLKFSGNTGIAGMSIAIAIGSIICIVAAIAGDTSQDLKTGYLLGATPRLQQIGEVIGVVASALVIGGVLYLLNSAWGYGTEEVPAPQATLMKTIVEGIMGENIPWNLVFIGALLGLAVYVLRIPVMPFAIGLYLPIYLCTGIMVGGLIRLIMQKWSKARLREQEHDNRLLFCAGMIAGEGLVGILLAIFALINLDLSLPVSLGSWSAVAVLLLVCLSIVFLVRKLTPKEENESASPPGEES